MITQPFNGLLIVVGLVAVALAVQQSRRAMARGSRRDRRTSASVGPRREGIVLDQPIPDIGLLFEQVRITLLDLKRAGTIGSFVGEDPRHLDYLIRGLVRFSHAAVESVEVLHSAAIGDRQALEHAPLSFRDFAIALHLLGDSLRKYVRQKEASDSPPGQANQAGFAHRDLVLIFVPTIITLGLVGVMVYLFVVNAGVSNYELPTTLQQSIGIVLGYWFGVSAGTATTEAPTLPAASAHQQLQDS